ncbi:hypothetical protein EVAR_103981_1 [Eumeta japonica]|uniref:Uncharacterized protein n=1 Tax=Eumeta variegata TaxID=151549 RepID=A0A4C1XVQ8_EUMVA|nr:hypothetical protein EVAR_103981_1 [Eumeta japonica]
MGTQNRRRLNLHLNACGTCLISPSRIRRTRKPALSLMGRPYICKSVRVPVTDSLSDPSIRYPILIQEAGNPLMITLNSRVFFGDGDYPLINGSNARLLV